MGATNTATLPKAETGVPPRLEKLLKQGILWLGSVGCVLLLFGTKWVPELSTDTYATVQDLAYNTNWMLTQNGRPAIAFFYWLWLKTGIPFVGAYHISFAMAAVLLGSAIYLIQDALCAMTGRDTLYSRLAGIAVGVLVVLNVFSIEYYMFVETGGFSIGIFSAVAAFWLFQRWLRGGPIRLLPLCWCFLAVSVLSYQATTGLFVVLCLPVLCRYGRTMRRFLTGNLLVAALYGAAMGLAVLLMTFVFSSGRIGGVLGGFFPNLVRNLTEHLPNELNSTAGILRAGTYTNFLKGMAVLCAAAALSRKNSLLHLLGLAYVWVGTCFTAVFPAAGLLPRTMYPAGSLGGLLLMYYLLNLSGEGGGEPRYGENRRITVEFCTGLLLALVTAVYLWAQFAGFQQMIVDRYKTNAEDQQVALMIGRRIDEYEAATGRRITKLVFYEDEHPITNYPGLFHRGAMGNRGFLESWSQQALMEYYLDRRFVRGEAVPEYYAENAAKNWDCFAEEQLIFDNDTLYICVY